MEAIRTIWAFVLLFGMFAFAQLLGVLVYFRVRRYQNFLAHSLGFLTPPLVYYGFSWMVFVYRYYEAHPDDRCGGQALGAAFIILSGTVTQIVFSLIAQIGLNKRVHPRGSLR
jgi:hypothetical protein